RHHARVRLRAHRPGRLVVDRARRRRVRPDRPDRRPARPLGGAQLRVPLRRRGRRRPRRSHGGDLDMVTPWVWVLVPLVVVAAAVGGWFFARSRRRPTDVTWVANSEFIRTLPRYRSRMRLMRLLL